LSKETLHLSNFISCSLFTKRPCCDSWQDGCRKLKLVLSFLVNIRRLCTGCRVKYYLHGCHHEIMTHLAGQTSGRDDRVTTFRHTQRPLDICCLTFASSSYGLWNSIRFSRSTAAFSEPFSKGVGQLLSSYLSFYV